MNATESPEIVVAAKVVTGAEALVEVAARPLAENPAAVYLAGLTAASSRSTMRAALNKIAGLLTAGAVEDAQAIAWGALRFQHTAA